MDLKAFDWRSQAWDDLVPRLLLFAASRLRKMTWRGERRGLPPGAVEAADFVNDAISKTISGIRAWNPKARSLFQHLAGVIMSDISHAAISMENRFTKRHAAKSGADQTGKTDVQPETTDNESEALWHSELRRLLDHLNRVDPSLRQMAELMLLQDMTETAELSRHLSLPPAEVANRRKRLKRAVRAYLPEIAP